MISRPLSSFSSSLVALCLFVVLSQAQTDPLGPEKVRRPAGDSIAAQAQEQGATILYFPDYVDGGGWSVQLDLGNVDPDAAAEVRVEVFDPDERPVLDLFDSDITLEIPSLGRRILQSAGSGAVRRGWVQVETESATVSGLLTLRHAESQIEVGVEPVRLGTAFALFVEESTRVSAGVAVFKPEAASRLELRLRDEEGNDPLNGGFVHWGDFHQAAGTLPEWFAVEGVDTGFLENFRGLLFLRSADDTPFAPPRAAVREAHSFTLGGAGDSGPGRRRPQRWESPPAGGNAVVHERGALPLHGDRRGPAAHPDGMRSGQRPGRSAIGRVGDRDSHCSRRGATRLHRAHPRQAPRRSRSRHVGSACWRG